MDTRLCSSLILPDSASGAWVDEYFSPSNTGSGDTLITVVYNIQSSPIVIESISYPRQPPEFRASQFACQSQWCHQIPLHWRLKESLKGMFVIMSSNWTLSGNDLTCSVNQIVWTCLYYKWNTFVLTNVWTTLSIIFGPLYPYDIVMVITSCSVDSSKHCKSCTGRLSTNQSWKCVCSTRDWPWNTTIYILLKVIEIFIRYWEIQVLCTAGFMSHFATWRKWGYQ